MRTQPFASPEEAVAHYGTRGMRWGYRQKEERAQPDKAKAETNAAQKKKNGIRAARFRAARRETKQN